ncbi:MAG: hypothetical protein ACRDK2_13885 [Solirubrobacteraceae bacterium]
MELQALAALRAFERAGRRVLGEASIAPWACVVAALGGITLGWIVGGTGRRTS